jgi:transposase
MSASERDALEAYARGHDRRLAARASAILAAADGLSNKDVAARWGMTKQTVGKWRSRFRVRRVDGLKDDPRPGAPRRITDEQVGRVLRMTAERAPNGSAWTTRSMAHAVGLTQTAISRIWRMHGVKPAAAVDTGNGDGRSSSATATSQAPSTPRPTANDEGPARARTLAAIHGLLHDAHTLRANSSPELDPLLALAIDAIERALEKHREPARSSYARAETALRNARHLLDQAEAAARTVERSLAGRDAAAGAAVSAIRKAAEGFRSRAAEPRRCPSCGIPYTLRFTVRGAGGNIVTTRMQCPRARCGQAIQVEVPEAAERVRLEEATAS